MYLVQRVIHGEDLAERTILGLYLGYGLYIPCISDRGFTCRVFRRGALLAVYLSQRALLCVYLGQRALVGWISEREVYMACISVRGLYREYISEIGIYLACISVKGL